MKFDAHVVECSYVNLLFTVTCRLMQIFFLLRRQDVNPCVKHSFLIGIILCKCYKVNYKAVRHVF